MLVVGMGIINDQLCATIGSLTVGIKDILALP